MKTSIARKSVLLAAILPLFAGCVTSPPQDIAVSAPPPPQTELMPPSPEPDYVWLVGEWDWHDHWVWQPGRWAPLPHRGAVWVHGKWVYRDHQRTWEQAHWTL
jgi:hypothetical protein